VGVREGGSRGGREQPGVYVYVYVYVHLYIHIYTRICICIYVYIQIHINTSLCMYPPDPINHVYSLPGK